MRLRILWLEWLLLAFLGVFLLYPLVYIVPGSASDVEFVVVISHLGTTPEERASVSAILSETGDATASFKLPLKRTFATERAARDLAIRLQQAGAQAEVVRHRLWTDFYFKQALGFQIQRVPGFPFFEVLPHNPFLWECLTNSLLLAAMTTLATTLLCLPIARWFARYRFRGQGLLVGLLLAPLILPPFVSAIGMQKLLGRFGTVNLTLMQVGLLRPDAPIDWLGEGGFAGVAIMQVLHLYPIMYLNLAAAWANVDPTLEDAARSLGADEWQVFRTITFPLLLPGYFAGASIVFIWSFTDLGTPLVFGFDSVIPVQIFNQVSDPRQTNATAYALVVLTLAVTASLFYSARWFVSRYAYSGQGKGAIASLPPTIQGWRLFFLHLFVIALTFVAVLPVIGVVLTAISDQWVLTPLPPAWTVSHLGEVWSNKVSAWSIRNSIFYSVCSTFLDIMLGVAIAWLISRRPTWLSHILDGLSTLPLALPGLVLAFGYLTCFSTWDLFGLQNYLDPTKNPVPLLIVAYAVRRLPYLTRSALAGMQQIAPVLEEAAENLGARRWWVVRTVTLPLIAANIVAGAVLTFAFAILEVSDSLMLAREEQFFPITRAILGLLMRPDNGDVLACALSVFAMTLLAGSLLLAGLLLGKKMGELFRA
ncbi:MAG: ABC transporter permease [Gemmatales bacterium]|nr:MAG: ABC transporter permease [Gemmatales bacterium]